MKRSSAVALLMVLLVIAAAVRSFQLTDRSLWFDEAFSWRLIQFPTSEMIARDAADVHPPLYYLLLKGWGLVFGTSLLALRSFSVLLSLMAILMGYIFTASAWRSRAVGLIAAALMAVAGWQIQYAWEARMYTLGIFLSLLTSWLLLHLVRTSQERRPISWLLAALYTISAAAFAYTHYFAFFTLAAHALFVAVVLIQRTRWRLGEMLQSHLLWVAASAAILTVVLYIPWIPVFLAQNSQVQESYWVPAIGGWSIPDTFYRMLIPTSQTPQHTGFPVILAALPILVVISLWTWLVVACSSSVHSALADNQNKRSQASKQARCEAAWLVMLSAAVPFVLAILVSFVGQSLYQDRFLVFTHVFILIGIARLLAAIPATSARRIAVTAVIVVFALLSVRFWQELDVASKPGAHAATQYIFRERNNDEPIFVSSPFVYFAIDHYAQEEFDFSADPTLLVSGQPSHFAGGPILTTQDIIDPLVLDTLPAPAFWMVDTTGFGGAEMPVSSRWRSVDRQEFVEVFPYQGHVIVHKYVRS
ncbi:MAG: glycosyltransferase family 39 protein [Candidatus Andersenbacteria bacterium]